MEKAFKIVLALAIFFYSLIVVGAFVLILKFLLLFSPELNIMGLTITRYF